jgi:hypothetical protein
MFHSNLFYIQLHLCSGIIILILKICSCFFFTIHYRIKAVVCHNILKVTVQCTAVRPCTVASLSFDLTVILTEHVVPLVLIGNLKIRVALSFAVQSST